MQKAGPIGILPPPPAPPELAMMGTPAIPAANGTPPGSSFVAAARAGDREAFGRLYDLYAPMVHGILLARVPVRDVDDLVQDVFLLAFRRLPTLRDVEAFGGWLAMIARNHAASFHRRDIPLEELPEHLAAEPASNGGSGGVQAGEALEMHTVLAVIRSLPEAYREPLILRLVEGMTGPEIAARTGLQPDSVRVNLHRGMKMLREQLEGRESA